MRHIIIVILVTLTLACDLARIGSAATEEAPEFEEITVYTALENEQVERYLRAFYKQHPQIKVNIVRESTGIITDQLLSEKNQPRADVVWGLAATSLILAQSEGLLEPYAPAGLFRIDSKFRDPGDPPAWVGIDVWMSAFCVNAAALSQRGLPVPQSWDELIDPMYEGLIVMPNPNSSGTGFLSVSGMLQLRGREQGWQYLDQLHQNIGVYTHSGSKPCQMAGSSEYPIGISFGYRGVLQQQAGDPIEIIFPQEGSGWEMEANALVRTGRAHPAAKTFLDWAISDAAMNEYAQAYAITGAPTNQPVPPGFPANPITQLIDNNFAWAAANRRGILDEWSARYDAKTERQ